MVQVDGVSARFSYRTDQTAVETDRLAKPKPAKNKANPHLNALAECNIKYSDAIKYILRAKSIFGSLTQDLDEFLVLGIIEQECAFIMSTAGRSSNGLGPMQIKPLTAVGVLEELMKIEPELLIKLGIERSNPLFNKLIEINKLKKGTSMPALRAARNSAVRMIEEQGLLLDPAFNIAVGVYYLQHLMNKFSRRGVGVALDAYNRGEYYSNLNGQSYYASHVMENARGIRAEALDLLITTHGQ